MFKKLILSASFLLATHTAFSQGVAINEDNSSADASAILDVKSTTKGLLIPRLTQTQRDAISTPATGLIIYQTDATAGFYYYNGTAWTAVVTPFLPSWGLTGNAATAGNFIGTTNNIPLEFKVNNQRAGYISTSNTSFGYQALLNNTIGNDNVANGYQALLNNTTGTSNVANGYKALALSTTGSDNVGNGYFALSKNTTGELNVATGSQALYNTTTGSENVATGSNALWSNTTGSRATAIGYDAMRNSNNTTTPFDNTNVAVGYEALRGSSTAANNTGLGNSVLGYQAMLNNTTGRNNVANGFQALISNTTGGENVANGLSALISNTIGSGNTAIGSGAGSAIVTGNNNLALGNNAQVRDGSADNQISIQNLIYATGATGGIGGPGNVGIGTNNPTQAKLVVSGFQSTTLTNYRAFNSGSNAIFGPSTANRNVSIYASNDITATQFNAFSDVRIKEVIGVSNSSNDLATIAQIKITDYKHIDKVNKGDREIKKVIAQEVKEVYPQAVSMITDVVPNIYKMAQMNEEGIITVENDLQVGEKVKIIFADGEQLLEVKEATTTSFKVESEKTGEVFVYGREVSDFHVVDYEALSTLNISATQELLKRIEALEKANQQLTEANQALNTQVDELKTLKSEVEQIKELLQLKASVKE